MVNKDLIIIMLRQAEIVTTNSQVPNYARSDTRRSTQFLRYNQGRSQPYTRPQGHAAQVSIFFPNFPIFVPMFPEFSKFSNQSAPLPLATPLVKITNSKKVHQSLCSEPRVCQPALGSRIADDAYIKQTK